MLDGLGSASATDGGISTPTGDPVAPAVVDPAAPAVEPAATPAPATEPAVPASEAPTPAPEPKVNVTARLAALSREKREAEIKARAAEAKAKAAEAKATDFETLIQRAQTDPAAIDEVLSRFGLSFEKVVNHYAEAGAELTPEQQQAKAIADLQKRLDDQEKARQQEHKAAQTRVEEAARAEAIAGITQTIGKAADKYEICARLGDEAASDVFAEVVNTWNKAGQPQLMPGEYEEAVQAALELVELRYEERGRKLAKQGKGAPPANGQPAANGKPSELPANLTAAAPISDKDADILRGLIDKTAPANGSQRAKPTTINSTLGGSAPPSAPARGSMDPRDALREVTAQFQRR